MSSHARRLDRRQALALAPLLQNPALQRVFAAVDQDGDETRIVGGAVRNALLGRPFDEIDLATTAAPERVLARAGAAGLRIVPTGVDHGTLTLLADGQSFEITSLREDVETDGRRAKVRFGRDFSVDALRRDFTMNALYLNRAGELFDHVGGLDDLAARRVRFIGDPAQRIREDYLRILRFFRFSADYAEGPLDRAGLLAAIRERDGLARLSRERVRAELLKLVAARRAAEAVAAMSGAGLLGPLIACAPNPARFARIVGAGFEVDPLLRLAALALETPEDAERLASHLRLSNAEAGRLQRAGAALIALHGMAAPPGQQALTRLLFLYGRAASVDAALLVFAGAAAGAGAAIAFLRDAPIPRPPFTGADLLARGVSGRAVGEALARLRSRWIVSGFSSDPAALALMLDEATGGRLAEQPVDSGTRS